MRRLNSSSKFSACNSQLDSVSKCSLIARTFTSLAGTRTIPRRRLPFQVTTGTHSCKRQTTYSAPWFQIDRSWTGSTTGRSLQTLARSTNWKSVCQLSRSSAWVTPSAIMTSASDSMALVSCDMAAMLKAANMASLSRRRAFLASFLTWKMARCLSLSTVNSSAWPSRTTLWSEDQSGRRSHFCTQVAARWYQACKSRPTSPDARSNQPLLHQANYYYDYSPWSHLPNL